MYRAYSLPTQLSHRIAKTQYSKFVFSEGGVGRGEGSNDEPADREMFLINHSYSITREAEREEALNTSTMILRFISACSSTLIIRRRKRRGGKERE